MARALTPEKVALQKAQLEVVTEITKEVLRNPVVELVSVYALVEYFQKKGYFSWLSGTALEGVASAVIVAQQIAPLMPYLGQGAAQLLPALLPLLGVA